MIKNRVFTLLSIACFISSCTHAPVDQSMKKINGKLKEITIDNTDEDAVANLDSVVKSVQFVKLETKNESLIGEITKSFLYKDKIVILDKYRTNSVSIFDTTGKFISRIRQGKGPGEVQQIADCFVNDQGEIEILEAWTPIVKSYDINGKFLIDEETPNYAQDNFIPSDDYFFFYSHYKNPDKAKTGSSISIFDTDAKETISKIFPISTSNLSKVITNTEWPFYTYNHTVGFINSLSDTIYSLSKHNYTAKYLLRFSKNPLPDNFIDDAPAKSDVTELALKQNHPIISKVLETKKWLYVNYYFDKKIYAFYYDKLKAKANFNANQVELKRYKGLHLPQSIDADCSNQLFLTHINSDALNKWFSANKSSLAKNDPIIKATTDLNANSNPVIAILTPY